MSDFSFNVENGVAFIKAQSKKAKDYLAKVYGVESDLVAFNDYMIMPFSTAAMQRGLSLQQEGK